MRNFLLGGISLDLGLVFSIFLRHMFLVMVPDKDHFKRTISKEREYKLEVSVLEYKLN